MTGFDGRVALVTGGGQGIGAAIAARLAVGGARVAVLDLDQATAVGTVADIVAAGGTALAITADVTRRDQVQSAVDTVVDAYGALHILVNNAGVLRDNLLFRMSDEDWDTVIEVHLRGAFLCSQIAQRHLVQARYGRIVSLSSTSALGNRGQANYAAAKAGLQGFTKTLAMELGPFGVTVNAVAPGFIETAMTARSAERVGTTLAALRERVAAGLPVRRTGDPADVAAAVAFFAGEESAYVTGQVLYVDGGAGLRDLVP